jgi:copper chaperone NosL
MSDTTSQSSTDQRDDHARPTDTATGHPRRRVLSGAGAVLASGLAGCLGGGGGEAPDPVTLSEDADCDVCGMVISQHPGATAEIFYADVDPAGHDNPARFDSTWEAFQFDFQHDDWTREAFYVTDYSSVDYSIHTEQGQPVISTHYDRESFADATDVTFVVGSEVVGAMGRDLIGFADRDDATAFRDDHGGELAEFDEVTPEVVSSLGM